MSRETDIPVLLLITYNMISFMFKKNLCRTLVGIHKWGLYHHIFNPRHQIQSYCERLKRGKVPTNEDIISHPERKNVEIDSDGVRSVKAVTDLGRDYFVVGIDD